jgi:hypothetical protein
MNKKRGVLIKYLIGSIVLLSFFLAGIATASPVEIVKTRFEYRSGTWYVNTTLRHNDTGWDHYADAWRVVDEKGNVISTRTLFHPHEEEQPFTRSQSMEIPNDVNIVYVEAHCKVSGWSKQRVRVDLTKTSGDRFEVNR